MINKCMGCDTTIPPGAVKCPMCGSPIIVKTAAVQPATIIYQQPAAPLIMQTVVIENTGKKWKKLYVWSWVCFFFGLTSCIAAAGGEQPAKPVTFIFFAIAASLYIRSRAGAWWNHG